MKRHCEPPTFRNPDDTVCFDCNAFQVILLQIKCVDEGCAGTCCWDTHRTPRSGAAQGCEVVLSTEILHLHGYHMPTCRNSPHKDANKSVGTKNSRRLTNTFTVPEIIFDHETSESSITTFHTQSSLIAANRSSEIEPNPVTFQEPCLIPRDAIHRDSRKGHIYSNTRSCVPTIVPAATHG